jgi:hypothetical protein
MNLKRTLIAAALSAFAFGAFAQAASAPTRADSRQAKQEARIDQGVASGSLTKRETKKLEAQQNRIDRVENRAEADGTVTKAEKARVGHVQNKAKRDIRRQKHDRQSAASAAAN